MLPRTGHRHLHLVLGSPWKEALGVFQAGATDAGLWLCEPYDRGDLLLTVLDSRPAMLLCLETAAAPGPSPDIEVDEIYAFPRLLPVASVTARLGTRLPRVPGPVPDRLADRLLDAIEAEITSPTPVTAKEGRRCASTSRLRSSGLQAVVLAESHGQCAACDRDFGALLDGRGLAALEVHHLNFIGREQAGVFETTPEQLVAVCGGCHHLLHSAATPTVQELRFAWRPSCPLCCAQLAQPVMYGMPAAAPAADMVVRGCDVPEVTVDWHCGSCGHEWRD